MDHCTRHGCFGWLSVTVALAARPALVVASMAERDQDLDASAAADARETAGSGLEDRPPRF